MRAWGPGLEGGVVGKSADFVVEAIGTEVGTLGEWGHRGEGGDDTRWVDGGHQPGERGFGVGGGHGGGDVEMYWVAWWWRCGHGVGDAAVGTGWRARLWGHGHRLGGTVVGTRAQTG